MAAIADSKLNFIQDLYYKKLFSAQQIAKKVGVTLDSVYYFMRKHGLKRRSFSEQNKIRFDNAKPSFSLKGLQVKKLQELKAAGTFLYWAEGYKRGDLIDFTNSDVEMIGIFMEFLRKVCGVRESKLRAKLFCYPNHNIKTLEKFWSKITSIPLLQFNKPYVRKHFDESKKDRLPHGLIHIIYSDKKLLLLIKEWIADYVKKWAGT